jgi:hypothetical protein
MKSFIQFHEQNLPDSPHLILGKLGVSPEALPAGHDRERVSQVQKAEKNRINPYRGKLKPNKRGHPQV